jgi:hypothetical protein
VTVQVLVPVLGFAKVAFCRLVPEIGDGVVMVTCGGPEPGFVRNELSGRRATPAPSAAVVEAASKPKPPLG